MESIQDTLDERGKRYGEFKKHAEYAQRMKLIWGDSPGYKKSNYEQREAVDMILHKLARIFNGDPLYDDTWRDIAGYAQLVVNILNTDTAHVAFNFAKAEACPAKKYTVNRPPKEADTSWIPPAPTMPDKPYCKICGAEVPSLLRDTCDVCGPPYTAKQCADRL